MNQVYYNPALKTTKKQKSSVIQFRCEFSLQKHRVHRNNGTQMNAEENKTHKEKIKFLFFTKSYIPDYNISALAKIITTYILLNIVE